MVIRMVAHHLLLVTLALLAGRSFALDNGLGPKPPLGFNTWNYFGCDINEAVVRTTADKLLALGLAPTYNYLNIDDCWQMPERSSDGKLQADPAKFPSGMATIAADVHAKGLKFGIYSDAGSKTCAGYPGSRHHEEVDAATFAEWGVDYLKYDNCYSEEVDIKERYMDMRDALNKTGRPIYYSMCNWGTASSWEWGREVGNSWRTYEDIFPHWGFVLRSLDYGAAGLAQYAGPGGYNDPDMLEVGVGQFTLAQQRSHFALWALVKSPLLIGANLEQIPEESLNILKAKEVIAINQDDLGVAGDIIWKSGPTEIWAAPLVNNQRAVVLFNRRNTWFPRTIRVTWAQLGYTNEASSSPTGFKASVRDLYAEEDLGVFTYGFTAAVPAYDVTIIRITPVTDAGADPATQAQAAAAAAAADAAAWRPWSHPAAAELQARMRAASQQARKWDAWKVKWVAFCVRHFYLLSAVGVGIVLAVCVALSAWLRQRRWLQSQYQPCPYDELFSRAPSIALSRQSTPAKQLPMYGV